jgi:hypothetical protein
VVDKISQHPKRQKFMVFKLADVRLANQGQQSHREVAQNPVPLDPKA